MDPLCHQRIGPGRNETETWQIKIGARGNVISLSLIPHMTAIAASLYTSLMGSTD